MSETRTVRLGDYCHKIEKITSKNFPDETFQYVDLSSIDNKKKIITRANKILATQAPSRAKHKLKKGDILVSTVRPNLNAVAIVPGELDGCIGSTGFSVLRPTDELDPVYLFSWVCSPTFINSMVNLATGASYPAISDRLVKDSLIPLPPLEEQKKIAAEFTLKRLISQKRERQQELFEELKVSRFRQIQSSSQLRTYTLGELITYIQAGESPKCESYPASSGKPGILKLSALTGRKFNELENKQVLEEFFPNEKHRIIKGDILMSRKNTPELVGTVQFVEEEPVTELYTPDLIYKIKLDETKILPEYFIQISRTPEFRSKIENMASGSSQSMSNISISRLNTLKIASPDISAQKNLIG